MGTQVPVPTVVFPPQGGGAPAERSFNYRDIGTNIDCSARSQEDGSFQLRLTVEDTSVYTGKQDATTPGVDQMPVFRSFRSTNTLVLRDGQTRDFSAAADRVSGEVVRVAVTLRVVK
jgi:type II secretory pathway component GspD/PulD (secretin)